MPHLTRRRVLAGGAAVASAAAAARIATSTGDAAAAPPASEVIAANASVYDSQANFCAIDLVVAVAATERVVIENELPGGSDRTVDGDGKRALTTVVPADSEVLVYAVDLEGGTARRLRQYRVTEQCAIETGSPIDSTLKEDR